MRRTLSGLNSLDGEKDFIWCLNLPRVYISSPLDALRTFSRLNSLDGENDFIWCLNLPRVYISSPWMH